MTRRRFRLPAGKPERNLSQVSVCTLPFKDNQAGRHLRCSTRPCTWRCSRAAGTWGSRSLAQSRVCAPPCCAGVSSPPRPRRCCPAAGRTGTFPRCRSFPWGGKKKTHEWADRLFRVGPATICLCSVVGHYNPCRELHMCNSVSASHSWWKRRRSLTHPPQTSRLKQPN